MKLSAPGKLFFWIAVILAVVAVIGFAVTSLFFSPYAFWVLLVGFVVLALGCVLRGA